ncbi:hypothetical protein GYB22_12685 [bacterium]|nr:hypothetical protein [bacterium]
MKDESNDTDYAKWIWIVVLVIISMGHCVWKNSGDGPTGDPAHDIRGY